jgi:hypothetical protein
VDDQEQFYWWRALRDQHRLVELDYPVFPATRFGFGKPLDPRLARKFRAHEDRYKIHIESFKPYLEPLAEVPPTASDNALHWKNDWMPAFDGVSIYGFLAKRNPSVYLEIGSGVSTQFARKAVRDHGLRTKIVSIDPEPRKDIDALCDEVVRTGFQDADMGRFADLPADAMVFCDNSHVALQNSDVTVFMTEALPVLTPGVLVGIHDIFLPADYPPEWGPRFYNEQYLLTCWLLGGDRMRIELPVYYCSYGDSEAELRGLLADFWAKPNLQGAYHAGGAFWVTMEPPPEDER